MNSTEQREYLINRLLEELPEYRTMRIPSDTDGQRKLLRSLMNVRMPGDLDREFLRIQDEYLLHLHRGISVPEQKGGGACGTDRETI